MKLSIIIVNTNEWHVLQPCLRSVFDQTRGCEFEVIVVDNGSIDGTVGFVEREFPAVTIVRNEENLGFAAANNRGIRCADGDFILLLNPDTVILDGAIQKTVRFMEDHPRAGIAGCKLLFPDRSLQRSVRSFPTVWNVFCEATFLYLLFPGTRLFGRYYMASFNYGIESQVDWVCGAYLLFNRHVMEKIGLLDEQFYMYTEEVDYCYRAKQAGFEVWYTPGGEIIHVWGGMNAINRRVSLWTVGSQMLFFQKHFRGTRKLLAIAFRYMGVVLRVPVYVLGGCLRRNGAMFAKAYYAAFSLVKLITGSWKYNRGHNARAKPWVQV